MRSQIACKAVRLALFRASWIIQMHQNRFRTLSSRQYHTKIVRQMRRQIFRQMKQKAEWILDVFTSIFVKYESLFRIWRMQIASSDFLRDEGKNGENPLWIFEYFPEISRKICTQDACGKIRNRLWREICKQMACKVARRSLCGIALRKHCINPAWRLYAVFLLFYHISAAQTSLPLYAGSPTPNLPDRLTWRCFQSLRKALPEAFFI